MGGYGQAGEVEEEGERPGRGLLDRSRGDLFHKSRPALEERGYE